MLLWGPQRDAVRGSGGMDERLTLLEVKVKGQSQDRQARQEGHGV